MVDLKNITDNDLIGVIADDMEGIKPFIGVEVACREIARRRRIKIANGTIKDGGKKFEPQTKKTGFFLHQSSAQLSRQMREGKTK